MAELANRVTMDPEQCGGRPGIRGMRTHISDMMSLLANGLSVEEIPSKRCSILNSVRRWGVAVVAYGNDRAEAGLTQ